MFNVVINAPGRDPRSVQCMHRECGIGRDDANLVMLQGWSIASKHASLVREDDGIYIMSLGGKAPITINGTQVVSRHGPIGKNDEVRIGDYVLHVAGSGGHAHDGNTTYKAAANGKTNGAAAITSPAPKPAAKPEAAAPAEEHATTTELARVGRRAPGHEWSAHQSAYGAGAATRPAPRRRAQHGRPEAARHHDQSDQRSPGTRFPRPAQGHRPRRLGKEVLDEALGLGPLEDLLADDSVTEIMVNALRPDLRRARRPARSVADGLHQRTARCWARSSASSRRSAGASTRARRWSTRG